MRYIEEFRDEHKKDKTMHIIGCAPDLDDYPDNYFDNKVSIALNWAFIAFPKCTYFLNYHAGQTSFLNTAFPVIHRHSVFTQEYARKFLRKWILWFPPEDPKNSEWTSKFDLILMRRCIREVKREDFQQSVDAIMDARPYEYPDRRTIAHGAIQAALIMGAKRIVLTGCGYNDFHQPGHAQKRGLAVFYPQAPGQFDLPSAAKARADMYSPIQEATRWLREILETYGVELIFHHYKTGYEIIK